MLLDSSWGSDLQGLHLKSAHCITKKRSQAHTCTSTGTHLSGDWLPCPLWACPSMADKTFRLTPNAAGAARVESCYANCKKWRLQDKCCHHQTEGGRQKPDYKCGTAASLKHRAAGLNVPGMRPLPPWQSLVNSWSHTGLHEIFSSAQSPYCVLCSHLKALQQHSEADSGDTTALTQTATYCTGVTGFGK